MSFRHVLTGSYTDQPTVYKLYFGKKYYTWKGKNLEQSVITICRDVARFHANGCPPGHLLQKVIDHVTRARVIFCRVEVLLQTDNLSELIDYENLTLAKGKEDPDCLNVKFEAHVPKWISDHGQEEKNTATANKAITDTFYPPKVSTYQPVGENKPVQPAIKQQGSNKLMDALAKLKQKS